MTIPMINARFTPAAFLMSASLALKPTMVTMTPKIRNRLPVKDRMSKSRASGSVARSPGRSSGVVTASSFPSDGVEGDVQGRVQDQHPATQDDRRPEPGVLGHLGPVLDLHPVDEPVQLLVRLRLLDQRHDDHADRAHGEGTDGSPHRL